MCLSGYSSAVYGPMGTKFGREVCMGHRKNLARFLSMETVLLPYNLENSLTARILGQGWSFLVGMVSSVTTICLQNMSEFYPMVSEIALGNTWQPPIVSQRQTSLGLSPECWLSWYSSDVARMTSSSAWRHATSLWCPTDRHRSHEYAKFWIFQIGPLLAEIWPIL